MQFLAELGGDLAGLVQDATLHASWLVPLLALLITLDGPLPMLPSETVLMSATVVAAGDGQVGTMCALYGAAVAGSMAGDLLTFGLGATSARLVARRLDGGGPAAWVRATMLRRPLVALVGARFLPGGRLLSTAAAGRVGLDLGRFLAGSVLSSVLWGAYMMGVGLAAGPVTGGDPLLGMAVGLTLAALTSATYTLLRRIRAGRRFHVLADPRREADPRGELVGAVG